jgi:hypothetical protein
VLVSSHHAAQECGLSVSETFVAYTACTSLGNGGAFHFYWTYESMTGMLEAGIKGSGKQRWLGLALGPLPAAGTARSALVVTVDDAAATGTLTSECFAIVNGASMLTFGLLQSLACSCASWVFRGSAAPPGGGGGGQALALVTKGVGWLCRECQCLSRLPE